jgi:hypothetical protein
VWYLPESRRRGLHKALFDLIFPRSVTEILKFATFSHVAFATTTQTKNNNKKRDGWNDRSEPKKEEEKMKSTLVSREPLGTHEGEETKQKKQQIGRITNDGTRDGEYN